MIRVIIDTGVIVSAAFKDRTPEAIILAISSNDDFDWIATPAIVKEYTEVLARKKFRLPPSLLQDWSDIFEECVSIIEPEITIDFPRDQKDAIFLECALSSEADYLITGDKDFVEAKKLVQTTIISVPQFKKFVLDTMR
ncbi:MAG: putative toxin-antitoxin system toxin component, PIN family [Pyrinomonadaceae bacterium]